MVFTAEFHILDSKNGRFSDRLKKNSTEDRALLSLPTSSPSCSDRAPSPSSDSRLSVASQGQAGAGPEKGSAPEKVIPRLDFEIAQPLLEVMAELAARGRGGKLARDVSQLEGTVNGNASPSERETDILEDECEGDSQTSPAVELPSLSSTYSLSSENMPDTQTEYSTHSWVRQQQMVGVIPSAYLEADGGQRVGGVREKMSNPLVAAETPSRGTSRREAVQRGPSDEDGTQTRDNQSVESVSNTHSLSCHNEDLASLTTDIDESIEQLNQLILDLDPTFVPVPTRCSPLSRSASVQTNCLSQKGNTHLSGNTHTQQSTTRDSLQLVFN